LRVLTRDLARARHLEGAHVEPVVGSVRDPRAVERAVSGVRTVVSAIHGLVGSGADSPRTVDEEGNANLIRASQQHGVEHFVLISIHGARPGHPLELARRTYAAEEQLRASSLAWTIIRPTAYMETWAGVLGEPLLRTGSTRIFGGGSNPVNFVSAHDVARLVELSVVERSLRGALVEIGGPEDLTLRQFVDLPAGDRHRRANELGAASRHAQQRSSCGRTSLMWPA
jgi:NADH dehydrogenase